MRCKLAGAGANRGGRQLMRLGREGWRGQFRCGQRGKCRHEVETREFKQEKLGESIQQLALIWQYLDTICDFTSWFFLISADKEWSRANTSLQAEYKFTVVQISNIYTWIRVFVSGFITIRLIPYSPLCSFKILPLPLSMKAPGAKRNLGRLAYLMQTKKWNPWSIAIQTE